VKIAVIGATGMLGHHTAQAVVNAGHDLYVIHRKGSNLSRLGDLPCMTRVADLDQAEQLGSALSGLDGVIHAAAYYPTITLSWQQHTTKAQAQISGFLDACRQSGITRAVYVGAAIALPKRSDGHPADEDRSYPQQPKNKNAYLQCKWLMDQMVMDAAQNGLPISIAIPSMTFGEYDYAPSTGRLILAISKQLTRKYVSGKRNVVYAGDAGRGIFKVLEAGIAGQRYFVTGQNTDMAELSQMIAAKADVDSPAPVPLGMAKLVSRIQSFRHRYMGGASPVIDDTAIAVMSAGQHLDGSKAERELQYRPELDLEQTLDRTLTWFRSHGYLNE